jgi:hypothetical protein
MNRPTRLIKFYQVIILINFLINPDQSPDEPVSPGLITVFASRLPPLCLKFMGRDTL